MFNDGSATQALLGSQPPSDAELRSVAVALIGIAVSPEETATDGERQTARDISQALGLIPTIPRRYRDSVTRQWRTTDGDA